MNLIKLMMSLIFMLLTSACNTVHEKESERYQKQVNRLSQQLKDQEQVSMNLKDENLVLRQLAGVPEPAIKRVGRDGKKELKVYSEKFLYSQVVKAFKVEDAIKLDRTVKVFLQQYPSSQRADNAIYYRGLLNLRKGRIAESLEDFDAILDKYPKANKKPAALLGKALAYKTLNLNDQAKLVFEQVVTKYPKTPENIRAKRELRDLEKMSL
jgi:TolA-binding protein